MDSRPGTDEAEGEPDVPTLFTSDEFGPEAVDEATSGEGAFAALAESRKQDGAAHAATRSKASGSGPPTPIGSTLSAAGLRRP